MAATKPDPDPERRLPGVPDRRGALGGGGRRAEDQLAAQFSAIIPCVCGVAWATLRSVADQGEQSVATYICPRCGHLDQRIAAV